MKHLNYLIAFFLFVSISFVSCNKDDDDNPNTEPNPAAVQLNEPINNFVWKAMNSWYNWKDEVPNLADTKDDVLDTYYTYLNSIFLYFYILVFFYF